MKTAISYVLLLMLATCYAASDPTLMGIANKAIENATKVIQQHMPAGLSRAKRSTVVSVSPLSRTQFLQCQANTIRINCENGDIQRAYTQALECQRDDSAGLLEFSCGQNSNGYYCGQALQVAGFTELQACQTLDTCSPSCSTAISGLDSELGCCSGYLTNASAVQQSFLADEFWNLCEVSPGALCPISPLNSTVVTTRNCTDEEFSLLVTQTACMPENLMPVIDAQLANEGCESLGVAEAEICSFNEVDEFCILMDTTSLFVAAVVACADEIAEDGECSSNCSDALLSMRNELGCCINSVLNGTLIRVAPAPNIDLLTELFSYSFWSNCGVETPGSCESTVNLNVTLVFSGATKQAAGGLSLALMMLATALFAIL